MEEEEESTDLLGSEMEKEESTDLLGSEIEKEESTDLLVSEMEKEESIYVEHSPGDADYDITISAFTIALITPMVSCCR